jgi:hypothetical protein
MKPALKLRFSQAMLNLNSVAPTVEDTPILS